MALDANKALVRRFVDEAQSRGNLAAIDEYLAPGFVDHSALPGFPDTRDGVRALFGALRQAFPDLQAEIHEQIAQGDRVVTRKTLRGTHQGDLFGVPASGRRVAFDVIDILRVDGGRITDHWNVLDQFALMTQIGAIPAGQPG
jgi:steroid delta-isomerase-like uncharacterized protein